MVRRITKARIKFISLVPKGANRMPVIYKAEDGSFDLSLLSKASDTFEDNGEILAVVYAPELRDSQGDIADAKVIKEMMHSFAKSGEGIDVRHDEKKLTRDQVYVAEQFIVQKGDARFADFKDSTGNKVDVTGAWATVIKIEDPEIRTLYKEGKWQGVSMGGTAQVQAEKTDGADGLMTRFLKSLATMIGLSADGDIDMTKTELEAALTASNATLLKGLTDALAPLLPAKPKEGDKPVTKAGDEDVIKFEGEPTADNLKKHSIKVRKAAILKGIDYANAESVDKAHKALEVLDAELAALDKSGNQDAADVAAGITKSDSPEVKVLKRQLFKAQKVSKQTSDGTGKNDDDAPEYDTTSLLSKEEQDSVAVGRRMAQYANKQRGHAVK